MIFSRWLDGFKALIYSAPNGWFHMAIVVDGPSRISDVSLYINGANKTVDIDTRTVTMATNRTGSGDLIIGRYEEDSKVVYANILMDELYFWNRVLSEEEIREMYNSVDLQAYNSKG